MLWSVYFFKRKFGRVRHRTGPLVIFLLSLPRREKWFCKCVWSAAGWRVRARGVSYQGALAAVAISAVRPSSAVADIGLEKQQFPLLLLPAIKKRKSKEVALRAATTRKRASSTDNCKNTTHIFTRGGLRHARWRTLLMRSPCRTAAACFAVYSFSTQQHAERERARGFICGALCLTGIYCNRFVAYFCITLSLIVRINYNCARPHSMQNCTSQKQKQKARPKKYHLRTQKKKPNTPPFLEHFVGSEWKANAASVRWRFCTEGLYKKE